MYRFNSVVVALSLGCTIGEDSQPHTFEGVVDLDSALLVRSRDHLQVCLQVDPALAPQTEAIAAQLRDDLGRLDTHRDWAAAGLDRDTIEVVIGCPGDARVEGPLDSKGAGGTVLGPGMTMSPSPYRAHIHAITDARAEGVLGQQAFARAIAELAPVDDHRVAEVSTALIVRGSAIGTAAFRDRALAPSLGLRAAEVTTAR